MCIQFSDPYQDGDLLRTNNIVYNLRQSDPIKAAQTDYILPMIYSRPVPVSVPSIIFPTAVSITPPNAIITAPSHGIKTGANVYLSQFNPTSLNGGPFTTTVTDVNTFSVPTTAPATAVTIGNVTVEILPKKLTNALESCVVDGTCKYVGYDFITNDLQKASNTTFAIDTSLTGGRDSSVFTKNGIQNITTLIAPPGYTYQPNFASYVFNGSTLSATNVDQCAEICNKRPGCTAFNHDDLLNLCQIIPGTPQFSTNFTSSYIGFVKEVIDHFTLPATISVADLSNEGNLCMNYSQCNFDMNVLVYSNVQAFTTNDLGSCAYCPVRSYEAIPGQPLGTGNVTTEIGTFSSTPQTLKDLLIYKALGDFKVPPLADGGYTMKPWIKTIDSSVTLTFQAFVYKQRLFTKDSNNLYSSIHFVTQIHNGVVDNSQNNYGSLQVVPTSYVDNGYTLYDPGRGTLYFTGETTPITTYLWDCPNVNGSQQALPYRGKCLMGSQYIGPAIPRCPVNSIFGGVGSTDVNGVFGYDSGTCHKVGFNENLKPGMAEYNYGIFIFTPRLESVGSFFNSVITSNTYISNDSGDKFAISLGAPNFKTYSTLQSDIIIPSATDDPNCQSNQIGDCQVKDLVKFSTTIGLSLGDMVNIGAQTFKIMQTPTTNTVKLSTKFSLETSNIYYKTGIVIQTSINRRYFPTDFDGSITGFTTNMFDFYQDVSDQPWTELTNMYTQLRSVSFDAGPMPDPYEPYALFRTLALPSNSQYPVNMTAAGSSYPVGSFTSTVYIQDQILVNDAANWGTVTVDSNGTLFTVTIAQVFTTGMLFIIGESEYVISSTNGTTNFSLVSSSNGAQGRFTPGRFTGTISVWEYGNVKSNKLDLADAAKFPYWSRDRFKSKTTIQNADGFLESKYGCPGGYKILAKKNTEYCEVCPAGTYSRGGHTVYSCTQCTLGNYCPKGSHYDGPQCPAGYFCPDTKSQFACPKGYFCPAGTSTPISCDTEDTNDGTFVSVPVTSSMSGTNISVTGSGFNFVDGMVAGLSPLIGVLKLVSSSTNQATFTPSINQNFSSLGLSLTYHTMAHYCPINSSTASLCHAGNYCPQSSSELNCPSGSFCPQGVYKGKQCAPDTYYRAPQISSLLRGQANSDGSHCYTCPSGITTGVNSTQDGCICADSLESWSLEEELCITNCPAGQYAGPSGCTQCPAGTFNTSYGPHAACSVCPDNFVSSVNSTKTGCVCTNERHDGYTVPGTVTWNSTVNRCQITSCNPGYTNFWSNCVPINVASVPKPLLSAQTCGSNELKWVDRYGIASCYKCRNSPPAVLINPITLKYGAFNNPGWPITTFAMDSPVLSSVFLSNTPQPYMCAGNGDLGYRDVFNQVHGPNAAWLRYSSYSAINCTQTPLSVYDNGPACNYYQTLSTVTYPSSFYGQNSAYDIAVSKNDFARNVRIYNSDQAIIVCPPCFSPNQTNDGCFFNGGTDSSCYQCNSPTINYTGTSYQIYQSVSTGSQCPISGTLPTPTQYFLWGNDGSTPQTGTNSPWTNLYSALQAVNPSQYFNSAIDGTRIYQRGRDSNGNQCPAGSYCIGDGSVVDCPRGYYCPTASIEPTQCTTAGTYCPPKSSAPVNCPAGSYCPTQLSTIYCPGGTYNSYPQQTSQTACLPCPAGSYCPVGSVTATNCASGKYCPLGSFTENPCPAGFFCPNPSTINTCPAGYSCPAGTVWNHNVCTRVQEPNSTGTCSNCPVPLTNQIWDPSSWTINQTITLPVTSVSATLTPSSAVISSCYQKTVRVSNVQQNLAFIATVKSFDSNNLAELKDVPAYIGSGSASVWDVTLYGCDTKLYCTGHSSPGSPLCSICPLPKQGNVWSDSTSCKVTQCPYGPYSTVKGTSTAVITRPIKAPVTMTTSTVFDIGYQVLVYNSKNTSFVGTVGISTPTQVTFNDISDVTCDFQYTSYNDWTLEQYGCKYLVASADSSTQMTGIVLKLNEIDLTPANIQPDNPISVSGNPVYSISFWLKPPPISNPNQWLSVFGFAGHYISISNGTNPTWTLNLQTAHTSSASDNYSNWAYLNNLSPSTYYHIVCVVNGTNPPQLYLNGVLSSSVGWYYAAATGTTIAYKSNGSDASFGAAAGAKIKRVYFYNTVQLNQDDVSSLYDPVSTFRNSTPIQIAAVDPSTLTGPWSVTPPECTSGKYSFSMDIQLAPGWSSVGGSAYYLFKHAGYSPYFSINNGKGGPGNWGETNGVTIDQQTIGNSAYGGNADVQVYNGGLSTEWTTVTVVSDGTYVNLYLNGILTTNITAPDLRVNTTGIKWVTGQWTWEGLTGRYNEPRPGAGLVQMKNFYWWSNRALSTSDISQFIQQVLLNSATPIQVAAVDPGTLKGNWSVTPPECTSGIYTFSMDILLASEWKNVVDTGSYCIFNHTLPDGSGQSPYFGLTNGVTGGPWSEKNGFTIVQSTNGPSSDSGQLRNWQVFADCVTPGSTSWTNITVVADGTKETLYVNGVPRANPGVGRTNTSGIKWSTGTWAWGSLNNTANTKDLVKMRNFYWWSNKALSLTEISQFIQG